MSIQNSPRARWDMFFLRLCALNAQMSKDPSTKVGSVIVRPDNTVAGMGWNGFPRGADDNPSLYENRELKYSRTVHAEVNAILNSREALHGCTLYSNFFPCDRCMPAIIQAGITTVITQHSVNDENSLTPATSVSRWHAAMTSSRQMAVEVGINVVIYP